MNKKLTNKAIPNFITEGNIRSIIKRQIKSGSKINLKPIAPPPSPKPKKTNRKFLTNSF